MPIWKNLQFPEVAKLENFDSWKRAGMLLLHQLFENEVLQPFDKLAEKYQLSNKSFFSISTVMTCFAKSALLKYNPSLIVTLAVTLRRSKTGTYWGYIFLLAKDS